MRDIKKIKCIKAAICIFAGIITVGTDCASVSCKTADTTEITISAAGDCTLGSDQSSPQSVNFYAKYNEKKNPGYFFSNVKEIFEEDDMTIVNFEGTLTNSSTRADKTFAFKGAPSYVKILKKGSIEAVAFANNHCKDYGQQSYDDTKQILKDADIRYSSYGKTAMYKAKGKKIGMVSVNGLEGIYGSKEYIKSGIKRLKNKDADIIIVSMHAGIERIFQPNDTQNELAHYAIDQGANLVLGHHPHVLQGIDIYKGCYIVYSLGNFCFGGNTNPADKDTMIFQQTFTFKDDKLKKDLNAKVIPCSISSVSYQNDYRPTVLKGSSKKRIIDRLNSYSSSMKVHVTSKGKLKKKQ